MILPRYREEDYSPTAALENIGSTFLQMYREELKAYAQNPGRREIVEKIHSEWDTKYGHSAGGTDIRIEWAVALYRHGDWEKAVGTPAVKEMPSPAPKAEFADPRKKYPAEFRCENGVYVRSLSELFIADWLYANRIVFEYEREVFFPLGGQYAHCDFYLPDGDVYVEFWGMENDEKYKAYKQWKENLYKANGLCLLSLNFQDLKTFRDAFGRKLKQAAGTK